ncbi:STAS/SEC14 domain-containing protein [Congregibacter litoralis]|uniref:SpoIIAA-like protein n=1 Tax=Congregibacter litoralis KT71 TaxID=314285 RepID=A4A4V2_9GAMM|nr:STAS/SEC14 domain-containing protein [Congregibacter litoralis]EAQ98823.2 hypothetical protein KT71_09357 [Congregibacter litoralis KT71]
MLRTQSIEEFATHLHGVYGFRVKGEISSKDLEDMAERMNQVFDRMDKVDMLVSFENDEGAELGAGLNVEVIKAQFRALTSVRNYCVAYAPESAKSLIEFFDNILPVKARAFGSEHNALEHLRAQEPLTKKAA